MTKSEYTDAYMKGVLDAWNFARENKGHLDNDNILTVIGANAVCERILEWYGETDNKEE